MADTADDSSTTARESIEIDGRARSYTVVAPVTADRPRDLVLIFHGSRQTGDKHRTFTGHAFDALTRDHDAVVVYLDGHAGNWNDARRESRFPARLEDVDDVAFVRAVIRRLATSHAISPDRVFAVGYSNGGQMVMRLAHETPRLLAGAAVISATMPASDDFLLAGTAPAAMPVLLIHGTKDRIVSYQGGEMSWWARKLFKVGGRSLSMPETAAYFAAGNGLDAQPRTDVLALDRVERSEYRGAGRPPVALYTVVGGGHTVPGPKKAPFVLGKTTDAFDTAQLVAEFFDLGRPGRT